MKAKAPRLTAKSFAAATGIELGDIKRFQKMAKSYNDAARKWAARNNYEGNLWRPWTMQAMAQSRSRSPAEAFRYAMEELQDRLRDGVSNILNAQKNRYVQNLMTAISTDSRYLTDPDMQKLVDRWQRGKISEDQIFRATGGMDISALYISKEDSADSEVSADFTPVMEKLKAAKLI